MQAFYAGGGPIGFSVVVDPKLERFWNVSPSSISFDRGVRRFFFVFFFLFSNLF